MFIEQYDALEIYVGAGDSERTMQDRDIRKVTNGERNFTMAPTQKFFVLVNGTAGAKYPMFNGKIVFRYYEFDPNCPEGWSWDGSSCKFDFNQYCASLT